MTTFLNVTDAVGSASNHGITRTERKLAEALATHTDVEFVAMHHGRLWRVPKGLVLSRLRAVEVSRPPSVERLGVDRAPGVPVRSGSLRQAARSLHRAIRTPPTTAVPLELRPLSPVAGDALISAGLDWVHGLLGEAERLVYAHGVRYIGFCYDLIPIDHPEWLFPADPIGFLSHVQRATRVATKIVCISHHTRRDFQRHFPTFGDGRLPVLTLGADATVETRPQHLTVADSVFGGEPYAIYCATLDRRKNHQLLYRAMREMARRNIPGNLMFVGRLGSGVGDLIDAMRHDPSVAGRIAHVTDCDDEHLAAFYQRAAFAVYPSLYEGWGLGVTEALAHATPCLIASGSSLSEAGLGVCRELSPLRTVDWVESMARYFDSPPTVGPLELPTWASAAEALIEMVSP